VIFRIWGFVRGIDEISAIEHEINGAACEQQLTVRRERVKPNGCCRP
jgi:hypothetical protein